MNFFQKHFYSLIIFLSFIALVPYLLLAFYSHPIADDLHYSWAGKSFPLAERLFIEYNNWNGRYFSNILVLNNPMAYDSLLGYQMVPIVLITLVFLAFNFFIYSISNGFIHRIQLVAASMVLTLLLFFQMPVISENLYWYTGAVTYLGSSIVALLHFSLLIQYCNKKFFVHPYLHLGLMILLLIASIGFNEVIMLVMLLFYGIAVFRSVLIKSQYKLLFMILLIVVIICSVIVFFAPGNEYRQSHFSNNHHFFKSIGYTILQTFRFISGWISQILFISIAILSIPGLEKFKEEVPLFKNNLYLPGWLRLSLFMLLPALCIFPAYWSTGILGQQRTLCVALFFFSLLWLAHLVLWAGKISFNSGRGGSISKVLFVASILIMAGTANGYNTFYDLFYGKAKAYDKEMLQRESTLQIAKQTNAEEVNLPLLQTKPTSIYVLDILPGSSHWINDDYAKYYGLKKVGGKL